MAVYADAELVATVASQDQTDLTEILNTGVGIRLTVDHATEPAILTITLSIRDGE